MKKGQSSPRPGCLSLPVIVTLVVLMTWVGMAVAAAVAMRHPGLLGLRGPLATGISGALVLRVVVVTLVVAAASATVAALLVRRIAASPLRRLADRIRDWPKDGGTLSDMPACRVPEVVAVTESLQAMAARARSRETELTRARDTSQTQAQRRRDALHRVLRDAGIAVLRVAGNGTILEAGGETRTVFGRDAAMVSGQIVFDFIARGGRGPLRDLLRAGSAADGGVAEIRLRACREDGSEQWADLRVTRAVGRGRADEWQVIVRDAQHTTECETRAEQAEKDRDFLFDNVAVQVWTLADPEHYREANGAHAEFLGRSRGELAHRAVRDVIPGEHADSWIAANASVFESGQASRSEEWITNARGESRCLFVVRVPEFGPGGVVASLLCSARDVTVRALTDRVAREQHQLARSIVNAIPIAVWSASDERRHRFSNPAFRSAVGVSESQWRDADDCRDVLPRGLADVFLPGGQAMGDGVPTGAREHMVTLADGLPHQLRVTTVALPGNASGTTVGVALDLTSERRLWEMQEGQARLCEALPLAAQSLLRGIESLDLAVPEALALLGGAAGADRVRLFRSLAREGAAEAATTLSAQWLSNDMSPSDPDAAVDRAALVRWLRIMREGEAISARVEDLPGEESRMLSAQQVKSVTVVPVGVDSGFWGFLEFDACRQACEWGPPELAALKAGAAMFAAVFARRQILDELASTSYQLKKSLTSSEELRTKAEGARLEAEAANRAKSNFLAAMSHELRTPLTSILGLSEALQEQTRGPLNEHQSKALRTIETSGRHLLSLINDILDLSKIEAGKIDLNPTELVVEPLCQTSLMFVRQAARKKGITVHLTIEDDVKTVVADERTLKQVLVNLLSNAVKFTPEQGRVGLDVEGSRENSALQFSVWDTGIGIAENDAARLFRPFVQLDDGLSRQHEGTGLGLALVSRLVELHGGSVSLESTPGQGSRFTVVLPWNTEQEEQGREQEPGSPQLAAPKAPETTLGARVLLVDDNRFVADTIREYLHSVGYDVSVAWDGAEGVARVLTETPDVVLMDIQMPVMDGLEAIRRVRASGTDARSVPIIAVTALAMPGDRERCLSAGADDYVSKPLVLRELVQLIEARLRSRAREDT